MLLLRDWLAGSRRRLSNLLLVPCQCISSFEEMTGVGNGFDDDHRPFGVTWVNLGGPRPASETQRTGAECMEMWLASAAPCKPCEPTELVPKGTAGERWALGKPLGVFASRAHSAERSAASECDFQSAESRDSRQTDDNKSLGTVSQDGQQCRHRC